MEGMSLNMGGGRKVSRMSREAQVWEDDKEKFVKEVEKKLTVWRGGNQRTQIK